MMMQAFDYIDSSTRSSLRLLGDIQDFLWILPLIVFSVAAAGFIGWQFYRAKKRQENMQKAAVELGLEYRTVQPEEYDSRLVKFNLMQIGTGRQRNNFIVAKTDELSLVLFDYRYASQQGKNRRVYYQTVAWIISPQLVTPVFYLSPETWLSRIGDLLLKKDIDIQADPEFSKAFVLSGPEADSIREFFNPQRREALLKISGPTIECFPGELIFYRPGKLVPPDQLKSIMNEAFGLYQAFATQAS